MESLEISFLVVKFPDTSDKNEFCSKKSLSKFCWFQKNAYLCTRNRETTIAYRIDSLAQQVEHNTFNVGVLGSSP
ncbi:hypothetical protein, partial [Bacteroides caecigallinarum]|uniref:hypothetical protein n=1 Tax=Bacteroides caecigallinarum TaxID=1411144 RepID=UPI00195C6204